MNKQPLFQEVIRALFIQIGIKVPNDMQKEVYVAEIGEAFKIEDSAAKKRHYKLVQFQD